MTDILNNATAAAPVVETKNDKRLAELNKMVSKLGEEAAGGKDSLPKLAHAVVKAAADGVIKPGEKDKNGNDAATAIYTRYADAEGKKALHDHSVGGIAANASKLRQLITMGAMTTIDAVSVMQDAFEARNEAAAGEEKVKSAYAFYIDVAREQLKTDKALTTAELRQLAIKDGPKGKELEKELQRILKTLEGLVTGDNKDGLRDTDELTEAAMNAVKERLDKMAKLRATLAVRKQAAALGLMLA